MPLTENIDRPSESFETVPFYNFTSEDFTEEQGAMWNSKPYRVLAGEIKFYPVFLANHLAKHLINREMLRVSDANMMDNSSREALKVKILITNDEANKLLGMPTQSRIVKVPEPKIPKKELIDEKESKSSPISKSKETESIPDVEHTSEFQNVDIHSLSKE
jgi:hypothetical protein